MAVNVDIVYKTVLLILNKEQRGNLSPDEFNKVATQVQLEIFESYFDTLNQQLRRPDNDTEYADRIKNVDQDISIFKEYGNTTYVAPGKYFTLPTTSGASAATQSFTGNGTTISFPFTSITSSQLASSVISVTINGVVTTAFTISGANIIFNTVPANNAAIVVTATPEDFYRLGTVIYKDSTEAQLVQRNELLYINTTPLVAPTTTYPIYLYENNKLYVYPQTITSDVTVSYLRKPLDVIWNFTIPSGQNYYQYNPTNSVDFELSKTEQTNIILKILLYSGVVIRDPQIINVAAQQVQQEVQRSTL
jgi:hypothetical protein|tara:strand:+ start:2286 stop:3203 length:918 start_codon:yes stop_codon:yes gene_type:complete